MQNDYQLSQYAWCRPILILLSTNCYLLSCSIIKYIKVLKISIVPMIHLVKHFMNLIGIHFIINNIIFDEKKENVLVRVFVYIVFNGRLTFFLGLFDIIFFSTTKAKSYGICTMLEGGAVWRWKNICADFLIIFVILFK